MQTSLSGLFRGVVEKAPPAVPLRPGPGRPRRVRKEEEGDEVGDAVLESLSEVGVQPDEVVVETDRSREKRAWGRGMKRLASALSVPGSDLRMPGGRARREHEGPQVKWQLCKWMRDTWEKLGGSDEAWQSILLAVAEEWNLDVFEVKRIYECEGRWKKSVRPEVCRRRG